MTKKNISITLSSSALLKKLSAISSIIAMNPIVPILENFLFDIAPNQLTITASDIQTTLSTSMPINTQHNTQIAVPARMLLDTLKNFSEQPITFHIDEESYRMTIHSHNGNYTLAGENPADFPEKIMLEHEKIYTISSNVLKKALAYTQVAISNDELKPALSGMYLESIENKITFVAIDGHKLVKYEYQGIKKDTAISPIILPKKVCSLINTLVLKYEKESIQMQCNKRYAFFQIGDVSITTQLINERYPDYDSVIPKNFALECTLLKDDLLSAIKRIGIYANKSTQQTKFVIDKNQMLITAEDQDFFNEAKEKISCNFEGKSITIGFNVKFLISLLQTIQQEEIQIKMIDPTQACIISPKTQEKDENILLLIMPIIIQ